MKFRNPNNNIYKFLEPVLESGSPEEIKAARKEYWRKYKSDWRKRKRKQMKEYTIAVTGAEYKLLFESAKLHHMSITKYLKMSSLAYSGNKFLVPDQQTINSIRELLALIYNELQQYSDENKESIFNQFLSNQFEILEQKVLNQLLNPVLIKSNPL